VDGTDAAHQAELGALREELALARRQLVEAQQLARIGSWEWDIPANTVTWSDELFRIYGYEPQSVEVGYERFVEHVHPEDRESVDARNTRCFETHEPFEDVKRVHKVDGKLFLMRTRGEMILDAAGKPLRMIGVCEDVTDHEMFAISEQRRRRAMEINDTVIQSLALATYTVESDPVEARRLVRQALEHCQRIVDELLIAADGPLEPGALRREEPASAG
jgi:PAS domain S-box-containing protein